MPKNLSLFFIVLLLFLVCIPKTFAAEQILSATLSEVEPVKPSGGGGLPGGAIVGIAGGAVASGASGLAFAPLLLVGLEPNTTICAAAPLENITQRADYLQEAIKLQGGLKNDRYYFAQNDCEIMNGSYDMDEIILPEELKSANMIKVNITIVSQPYSEVGGDPELALGIYKDINNYNLSKKFETQQFLHHYLMKRYEMPLKITNKNYNNGVQKLSGIINMNKMQNKQLPMQVVVRYTEGGFRANLKRQNPKTLSYAYVIEFEKN